MKKPICPNDPHNWAAREIELDVDKPGKTNRILLTIPHI
jgi:hypothetical protein